VQQAVSALLRRRHKPDREVVAVRDARRRELADKVSASSRLPVDDLRIDLLSWALLGSRQQYADASQRGMSLYPRKRTCALHYLMSALGQ